MALSANAPRSFVDGNYGGYVIDMPLGASEVIYKGAAVSSDAGYGAPLAAGELFIGIALEAKTGGATDALVTVKVQCEGVVVLPVTSVAVTDIGKAVYASADGTFTLVGTSNSSIGRVVHIPATGTGWVALKKPGEAITKAATAG